MEDIHKKLGQRLNAALAAREVSQKELAARLGLERQANTVSYWCKGTRVPRVEQLAQIARCLDVSTDYLLGLTDVMSQDTDLQGAAKVTGLSQAALEKLRPWVVAGATMPINARAADLLICSEQFDKLAPFLVELMLYGKEAGTLPEGEAPTFRVPLEELRDGPDVPLDEEGKAAWQALKDWYDSPVYAARKMELRRREQVEVLRYKCDCLFRSFMETLEKEDEEDGKYL